MSCDVGEATEELENELWCRWSDGKALRFSAHSPSFPSLHLRHISFFNLSVALPTSQLILQPFRCFTYITAHFQTFLSLLLRHKLFTYVTWRAAYGNTYLSLLDKRKEWGSTECQVLSSLSQQPYGSTFHCTHRHESAANTTTKHPHTPNSSQTVTAINGTEPSWELQRPLLL